MSDYQLVRVKRPFIPHWLFEMFCWVIVYPPLQWNYPKTLFLLNMRTNKDPVLEELHQHSSHHRITKPFKLFFKFWQ